MPTQPTILGWSVFRASSNGHGGHARSEQIAALVAEAGFAYEVIDRSGPGRPLLDRWRGFWRKGLHPQRWRNLSGSLLGYYCSLLDRTLRAHAGPRVLLCEDTHMPVPLWLARRHGFKTIALPQNVESLRGSASDPHRLPAECAALRQADALFCISDEDAWLWANLGLAPAVLPYFPSGARRRRLESIAATRTTPLPPGAPWLLLGTAHHPPTREGLLTALRWLTPALPEGLSLVIAGHGTETLALTPPAGVTIAGALTDPELDDLLRRARGLIVHQERGTGALTRIPDALVAGLRVVASPVAARTTRTYAGVQVYRTPEELRSLVELADRPAPPPPRPPTAADRRFADCLHQFAAGAPPV